MPIELDLNTSAISEDALATLSQNEKELAADFIAHHGIKGQKWGVRRYQNPDGSLTEQGRQRYGDTRQSVTRKHLTKGQVRFAKDAIISLDRTPLSKDKAAFKDTLKQLGKAAEESGVMDPTDTLSPYRLSRSPDQSRLFDQIYENMPTVGHNTDEHYKKLANEYKKNADGYRKEKMSHLDETIEEYYPDLHKELGTKKGEDTRNFIVDAVKGFNEGDPDMVTYQHMEEIMGPFEAGYVDKKTFEKVYDGQAADDAVDWLGYGIDSEDIKKYNSWYKNLHHSDDAADFIAHHAVKGQKLAKRRFQNSDDAGDFIAHHGIKGQKWGVRRYQNSDGSLTTLGRARYGVGAAAKKTGQALGKAGSAAAKKTGQALGKAGSAAGKAIGKAARKAVGRETDEELNAELAKARKTHERAMKKAEIYDLTGKKKKLSKMTDAEVDAYIDRLAKEKSVRQAEKELKRMNQNAAQRFMSDLGGAVASGITEGVKRGVSGQIETSFRKSAERHQKVKDSRFDKNHPDEKNESKKLKEEADDSRNRVEAARNKLELEALGGDEKATERLYNVATAKKGGKKEKGDKEETPKTEKQKEPKQSSDDAVEANAYEIPVDKKDRSVKYETVQRTPTSKETARWINEMAKHKMI